MKNINKRFVAFIAVFSMFFGIIFSSVGDFRVYANETEKLVIGQIINEESKKILEDGMELNYRAEKISDDQMKINIKVNTINEEINTESLFVDCSFLDYFDILEEKIEVTNPELNNDEFKKSILEKKVVENKETVVVNLSSVDKSGTAISFTVKLKDLKDIADKTELELKAQLKRNEEDKVTLVEELQKIKVEILKQKEAVIDDTNNTENEASKEEPNGQAPEGEISSEETPSEEVTPEEIPEEDVSEEDTSNVEDIIENEEKQDDVEIDFENDQELRDDDKIGVEKTINPVIVELANAKSAVFKVTLKVTNKTDDKKNFTVKDYIDTNKFEFVSAEGELDNNKVTWTKEIKGKKTEEFNYIIKFKSDYQVEEGVYITNPSNKKGEASYSKGHNGKENFENVSIKVTESGSGGGGDTGGGDISEGTLTGTKTVSQEVDKDGNYDITFDITGTPGSTDSKGAKVIFMLDKSGSMKDDGKMEKAKSAAKNAVSSLLSLNSGNSKNFVEVAVASYSDSAMTNINFSSNKDDIFSKIQGIKANGWTNTEAAINKIANMIGNESNVYVVLLSDGMPKIDDKEEESEEKAIIAYNDHFSKPGDIGASGPKSSKFYSVGLFTGGSANDSAVQFMYQIQNAIKDDTNNKINYKNKYFTSDVNAVNTIFNEISNDIKGSITDSLATDAVLSDEISAEFEYVQGQEPSVTTVVNSETVKLIKGTDYTFTVNEKNKIVFNFPKIPVCGVKVTFKIKPSNDYFGTYDEAIEGSKGTVETNEKASLTTEEFPIKEFESPKVEIPYKKGTIKVTKKIDGEALSSNDRFIIGFDGPSKCNVEINGAGETTLDFYLRDGKTDITNNKHYGLNYMLAGAYTVEELVPMNYSNDVNVEVRVNGTDISGKKFTLDKNNDKIEIIVTNKVANRGFLNDRSDKSNIFSYK